MSDKCTLKLKPDVETLLEKLSIWFAWNAASGVRFVKILYTDGTFDSFEQVQLLVSNCSSTRDLQVEISTTRMKFSTLFLFSPGFSKLRHCDKKRGGK